jgi:hypothetical protein
MYSGWTLWSHEVGYGGSGLITTNFPSHNSLHPFDKITITTETDNGSNPSAQPGLIFHTIAFFDSTVAPPSTYTDGRLGHWSPVILSYGNVFQTIFVNVNYGKEELTQPINGTFAKFYPGITGVRTLAFYLNVYDNDTLIYRSENPHTYNSDGNPAHGVWYNETFTVNGQVFTINPQPGHTYYYLFMVYILDPATLQTVGASEFPLVITDKPVQSNQMGWIIGLIWIMILFTMPWLVNWFFPRYGFMLGMVMMAILLGITESGFLMVTLVIVITVAVMAFVIQRGN